VWWEVNEMGVETVEIVPLGREHLPAIQELASDPAIGATSFVPYPYPPDGAEVLFQRATEGRQNGSLYSFAVVQEGGCVGVMSLMGVDSDGHAELGYWIGKPYWGQGLATAAGRLILGFGFQELGLQRVTAGCLQWNPASVRVLEKLGFRLTHTRTILFLGQEEPLCYFECVSSS
jgi:ribosomal-protein-alanine N-acetyltransferase